MKFYAIYLYLQLFDNHFIYLINKSIYLFSSVPSEHRHQTFKLDLRHSFQGWKLVNPRCNERGLRHVVEMDALNQGLHILHKVGNKRKRLLQWLFLFFFLFLENNKKKARIHNKLFLCLLDAFFSSLIKFFVPFWKQFITQEVAIKIFCAFW